MKLLFESSNDYRPSSSEQVENYAKKEGRERKISLRIFYEYANEA